MSIPKDAFEIIWDYRTQIAPFLRKIRRRVRIGKETIIILGPHGVGKTSLGHLFSGKAVSPIYRPSFEIEIFPFEGAVFGSILVAPGDEIRRFRDWPDLRTEIAKGAISGVIYVVAGGYSAFPYRFSEDEIHSSFPNIDLPTFVSKYLERNRQNELKVLRDELSQSLKDSPARIWFVTAVLKKDLWAANADEVMHFYKEGPYAEVVREIMKFRGGNFVYECLPVSLLIGNLITGDGVVLAETARGFDTAKQRKCFRIFTRDNRSYCWPEGREVLLSGITPVSDKLLPAVREYPQRLTRHSNELSRIKDRFIIDTTVLLGILPGPTGWGPPL
jgi:hypothetical protein